MKYGVIDIGSNSVRLLISDNGKSAEKFISTTRLAQGMKDGFLDEKSSLRTLNAVKEFADMAFGAGADKVAAFATAAVRNAVNGAEFVKAAHSLCGIDIDVLSGEREAELACFGALYGGDGAVLDIGGGSTEIAVVAGGKFVYMKSLPMGAVVLTEKFGQNGAAISEYVKNAVNGYGNVPSARFYCIGGTCTSLAAVSLKLREYDPEKVDGYLLSAEKITKLARDISLLSVENRKRLPGLQPERADIIHAGAIILDKVREYTGAKAFTVRESDNLEGYLKTISGNI